MRHDGRALHALAARRRDRTRTNGTSACGARSRAEVPRGRTSMSSSALSRGIQGGDRAEATTGGNDLDQPKPRAATVRTNDAGRSFRVTGSGQARLRRVGGWRRHRLEHEPGLGEASLELLIAQEPEVAGFGG